MPHVQPLENQFPEDLTTSVSNICVPSLTGELQGALQTALAGGPASEDQGASNRRAGDLR